MPGCVDAHSHVGGTGDLNEMVYQTNPELRVLDQIRPHNDQLKAAVAGGVTTITFIPGSGTVNVQLRNSNQDDAGVAQHKRSAVSGQRSANPPTKGLPKKPGTRFG